MWMRWSVIDGSMEIPLSLKITVRKGCEQKPPEFLKKNKVRMALFPQPKYASFDSLKK